MKKTFLLIGTCVLLVSMIACEFAGITVDLFGEGDSAGAAIEVGIDSPANGATLPMGPVQIGYHASSTAGISAVELSINGEVVSSVASPESDQKVVALNYTWTPTVSGSHTIRARAQGSGGSWSDYSTATVNVEDGQPQPEQQDEPAAPESKDSPQPTATPDELDVINVKADKEIFYYGGGGCGSREVTISADINMPDEEVNLTLFTRFLDKESAGITKWDSGHRMSRKNDGHFSITLQSNQITNYNTFEFAIMRYQFVVTDKQENNIFNTVNYDNVSIERCP